MQKMERRFGGAQPQRILTLGRTLPMPSGNASGPDREVKVIV